MTVWNTAMEQTGAVSVAHIENYLMSPRLCISCRRLTAIMSEWRRRRGGLERDGGGPMRRSRPECYSVTGRNQAGIEKSGQSDMGLGDQSGRFFIAPVELNSLLYYKNDGR